MNSETQTELNAYTYIAHEGDLNLIMREIGTALHENMMSEDSLRDLHYIEGPRYKVTVKLEIVQ